MWMHLYNEGPYKLPILLLHYICCCLEGWEEVEVREWILFRIETGRWSLKSKSTIDKFIQLQGVIHRNYSIDWEIERRHWDWHTIRRLVWFSWSAWKSIFVQSKFSALSSHRKSAATAHRLASDALPPWRRISGALPPMRGTLVHWLFVCYTLSVGNCLLHWLPVGLCPPSAFQSTVCPFVSSIAAASQQMAVRRCISDSAAALAIDCGCWICPLLSTSADSKASATAIQCHQCCGSVRCCHCCPSSLQLQMLDFYTKL